MADHLSNQSVFRFEVVVEATSGELRCGHDIVNAHILDAAFAKAAASRVEDLGMGLCLMVGRISQRLCLNLLDQKTPASRG
jgi:hypothetical protein